MKQTIPLQTIRYVLEHAGSPVVLIGSLNLALQGIDINFDDVDFLTDDVGVKHFAGLLDVAPRSPHGFLECWGEYRSLVVNFTSFENNSLRIPITVSNTTDIILEGVTIPHLNLESELSFYKMAGRDKDKAKVQLIQGELSQR